VADEMKMPRDPKPKLKSSFPDAGIFRILETAKTYGRADDERRRPTAMVRILAAYGLRIGDPIHEERHALHAVKRLHAVYRKSGVENAVSHRFCHTLATNIPVNDGAMEDAANAPG